MTYDNDYSAHTALWHQRVDQIQEALRLKYATPETGEETEAEHDARLRRQMDEQAQSAQQAAAEKKIAELKAQQQQPPPASDSLGDEENRDLDRALAASENPQQPEPPPSPFARPAFGRRASK